MIAWMEQDRHGSARQARRSAATSFRADPFLTAPEAALELWPERWFDRGGDESPPPVAGRLPRRKGSPSPTTPGHAAPVARIFLRELLAFHMGFCRDLAQGLFVLMALGGERVIRATYIAGVLPAGRQG